MTLYKAVIAPCSSFMSPLQSDTFFGAFCWSYLRIYGQQALEELLALCREQKPPIIFSNAFPSGSLPLPFGVYDEESSFEKITDKAVRCKAYQANKNIKNASYVSEEAFYKIISGEYRGFSKFLQRDDTATEPTMHNMVSRNTDMVENIDGSGNLFSCEETFTPKKSCYDIYVQSTLSQEVLSTTLDIMCTLGIGADKSTGKGVFALHSLNKVTRFTTDRKQMNGFVALSNFIPAATDPVQGNYKTFVKFPRLDREFADSGMPFKKPMLFIKCGSTFLIDTPLKENYGRCIDGVSPLNKKIIMNACTIAIGVVIK